MVSFQYLFSCWLLLQHFSLTRSSCCHLSYYEWKEFSIFALTSQQTLLVSSLFFSVLFKASNFHDILISNSALLISLAKKTEAESVFRRRCGLFFRGCETIRNVLADVFRQRDEMSVEKVFWTCVCGENDDDMSELSRRLCISPTAACCCERWKCWITADFSLVSSRQIAASLSGFVTTIRSPTRRLIDLHGALSRDHEDVKLRNLSSSPHTGDEESSTSRR